MQVALLQVKEEGLLKGSGPQWSDTTLLTRQTTNLSEACTPLAFIFPLPYSCVSSLPADTFLVQTAFFQQYFMSYLAVQGHVARQSRYRSGCMIPTAFALKCHNASSPTRAGKRQFHTIHAPQR